MSVVLAPSICTLAAVFACGSPAAPIAPASHAGPVRFDAVSLEATIDRTANVELGDLDGDGDLDVLLAKGRHWPLVDRVLRNDGKRTFTAWDLGTASDRSYSTRLADLDGDRDLDAIVSNDQPDPKLVYLNDGTGHFTQQGTYGAPAWPSRNATVADVNGDKLPDVIAANRFEGDGANYVCLNRGAGAFDADCLAFSREPATTIAAADLDGDGAIDLAVPHRDGGQSYIYLNDGKGGFARKIPWGPPASSIRNVVAADLDGDKRADLVTTDERLGTFVWRNTALTTAVPIEGPKPTPYALALGDVNRDGRIDIVVGHVEAPVTVHLNEGGRFTLVSVGDNRGAAYGIAIGDIDGDGAADIAVARSDAPNVVYFGAR